MSQQNFICAVEANARRFGAKTALLCDDHRLTWSELDAFVSGFARDLSSQGVTAGDRVALLLPNGIEFVVAFFSALKLGTRPSPLNPLVNEEEVAALRPGISTEFVSQRCE